MLNTKYKLNLMVQNIIYTRIYGITLIIISCVSYSPYPEMKRVYISVHISNFMYTVDDIYLLCNNSNVIKKKYSIVLTCLCH